MKWHAQRAVLERQFQVYPQLVVDKSTAKHEARGGARYGGERLILVAGAQGT